VYYSGFIPALTPANPRAIIPNFPIRVSGGRTTPGCPADDRFGIDAARRRHPFTTEEKSSPGQGSFLLLGKKRRGKQ